MSETLTVNHERAGRVILAFQGPLDLASVGGMWQRTLDEAARPGTGLVIDLAGVTACDGAGIGLLVEADRAAGADVLLTNVSDALGELLRMARLDPSPEPPQRRGEGIVVQ